MSKNKNLPYAIDVAINLSEIFELIYAESAWISAHNDSLYCLTSDNEPMLKLKVREGYAQLLPKIQPYLSWANYNPNIDARNLTLTLQFAHLTPDSMADTAHRIIVEALAHYALMCFYHGQTQLYEAAWRKSEAQLMLLWARDANHEALY